METMYRVGQSPGPADQNSSGSYLVYFDGMIDTVTATQFETHDWHSAWSGPHYSEGALIQAARDGLRIERLSGEVDSQKSVGWHLAHAEHAFVPDNDERYCASATVSQGYCGLHARHHANAPSKLQEAPRRSLYPCDNTPCNVSEATQIIGTRPYCNRCAPQALEKLLLASWKRAAEITEAYARVIARLARKHR